MRKCIWPASILAGVALSADIIERPGLHARAPCATVRLEGEVRRGQMFEREIGSSLSLRLEPTLDPETPGWIIKVTARTNPDRDFVWVATPPFRGPNARMILVSYETTAQQAAAWSPRSIRFVTNDSDYQKAADSVRKLTRFPSPDEKEMQQLQNNLERLPKGDAELRIVSSQLGGSGQPGDRGWIEHLKFEADVCVLRPARRAAGAADSLATPRAVAVISAP